MAAEHEEALLSHLSLYLTAFHSVSTLGPDY